MTGLKYEDHGSKVLQKLIPIIKELDTTVTTQTNELKILNNSDIVYQPMNIVLINSDFDIKYKVNRELLHRDMLELDMCSSYEPTIYPGVNMKYYYNNHYRSNGVCQCTKRCNGKGGGDGNGDCKRITIAIFNSGKIIITGGKTMEQLTISYDFIKSILKNKKKYMIK